MTPKDRDESAAVCLTCAAPIPTAAPFGLCPTCLIGLARDVDGPAPSDRRRFGDYEVLDEVARGGMGVVFRATQRSLRRDVALKLMIGGELSSPAARRMFQTEALAAAALHHPHIVPVYDSGECELQPFIAMRFVAGGRNIAHWATPLREGRQWREIAATMAQVARAVCHAHDRGVLHRDLKPSNILWDAEAGPQVADFGLAKIIDAGSTDGVALSARMLGSPGYMAPELAGGGNDEVTVATDVYGLGAVLYELLSGRPPFQGKSALDTTRMVREEAPPPLRDVPKDIATICMKCLARVPGDRYASATALAEDLDRFVRGEPVLALPVPAGVRLWRWAKRKPAVAALLVASGCVLSTGVVGVTWQWRRAEAARRAQGQALVTAEAANESQRAAIRHLRWQEMDAHLNRGDAAGALARAAAFVRERPDDWQAAMFAMSMVDSQVFSVQAAPEITTLTAKGVAARVSPDGRWIVHAAADATLRVFDAETTEEVAKFMQPRTNLNARPGAGGLVAAPDILAFGVGTGPRPLAVATGDGQLTLRPLPSGQPAVSLIPSTPKVLVWELVFSVDGKRLMARFSDSVRVWNTEAPEEKPATFSLGGGISGAAFSADGGTVLAWNSVTAGVWDTVTGAKLQAPDAVEEGCLHGALSRDGRRAAIVDTTEKVTVWDVVGGKVFPSLPSSRANLVALNADGSRVLTGGSGTALALHAVESALPVAEGLWTHKLAASYNARFPLPQPWLVSSADGSVFATTGLDNTVLTWDALTGRALASPVRLGTGPDHPTMQLSADGSHLLTHSRVYRDRVPVEAKLVLWRRTEPRRPVRHDVGDGAVSATTVSADGRFVATGYATFGERQVHSVRLADASTGEPLTDLACSGYPAVLAMPGDGSRLFAAFDDEPPTLVAWDTAKRQQLWSATVRGNGFIEAMDVTPDGTRLVCGMASVKDHAGEAVVMDVGTGEEVLRLPTEDGVGVVRCAPDGSGRVLTAGTAGGAIIWQGGTFEPLRTLRKEGATTTVAAAWSRDGALVATGDESAVQVWDASTGQPMGEPLVSGTWVSHFEFSPDGTRLVAVSRDGTLRMWEPRSGRALCAPRRQGVSCETVRFVAGGAAFLVHDTTGFRLWDAASAEPLTVHFPAPFVGTGTTDCPGGRAIISPDGHRVFVPTGRAATALWSIEWPEGPAPSWFPALLEALALERADAAGAVTPVPGSSLHAVRREVLAAPATDRHARWARRLFGVK